MRASLSDSALYVLLTLCTVAVVIGVALEFWEDWEKVKEKTLWNERDPWRPIVPKVGFAILVLGLAGEIVFQTWIETRDTAFKIYAVNRITELSPRADVLSGEKKDQFVAAAKGFPKQKFVTRISRFSVLRVEAEPQNAAFRIAEVLTNDAGWIPVGGRGIAPEILEMQIGKGIWIEVSENASSRTREAAERIRAAFSDIPMVVAPQLQSTPETEHDPDTVVIEVMEHP